MNNKYNHNTSTPQLSNDDINNVWTVTTYVNSQEANEYSLVILCTKPGRNVRQLVNDKKQISTMASHTYTVTLQPVQSL